MSTDPLRQLYKCKCHSLVSQYVVVVHNKIEHEKHLLRTVVLIKVLVDTRATGCITQQLTFWRLNSVSMLRWKPLCWARVIELVPLSGQQNQYKLGYVDKPSARVKTNIRRLYMHEIYVHALFHSWFLVILSVRNNNRTMDNYTETCSLRLRILKRSRRFINAAKCSFQCAFKVFFL
jgi:hypothetical protein